MNTLLKFLSDVNGEYSCVRLMAIISLFAGIGFGIGATWLQSDIAKDFGMTLIITGFGAKIGQRAFENKAQNE